MNKIRFRESSCSASERCPNGPSISGGASRRCYRSSQRQNNDDEKMGAGYRVVGMAGSADGLSHSTAAGLASIPECTTTAESTLEKTLNLYGSLGRVPGPFMLRLDDGLVFLSRNYTRLVRS